MWRYKLLTSFLLLLFSVWSIVLFAQEPVEPAPQEKIEVPQVVEPSTQYDYIPEYSQEEVKARLKALNSTIELTYNKHVAGFINYFAVRNRKYTRVMIQRKNLYFPLFEKYLAKYGLPDELKYLAIVESGLNPKAVSRAGAVGLWQFMPSVGRSYGLKYDLFIDEKMSPEKSTEAACRFLSELYGMFHDWQLALASYNCGPGSLRRAIRKSGYKDGFWSIYDKLPRETRAYVPQFIAVTYVMNHTREHNLHHDNLDYPMEADTILVNNYLDLEAFSTLSKICLEDLQKLNPELKKNAVPAFVKNYPLKIPADRKEYFVQNRSFILDSASQTSQSSLLASSTPDVISRTSTHLIRKKVYHTVRRGEVLGAIADKHNVRISDVRKWNRVKGNTIRKGQRLVIYKYQKVKSVSDEPQVKVASSSSIADKPKRESVGSKYHVVQPGDTLWRIIQKYNGLTIEQLKKLNNLKTNNIKPGMKLVIS